MMNTFGPPKRVFVRGEGCYVWDADGRQHLDLLSGLAVNALGHAHPTVLAAITGQIATLGHVSNFFATPAQVALAGRLAAMTGGEDPRVFFTNSGTEANEAAFKITRMTGRTKIVAAEGGFHGRSLGALAITHNPKYRLPFEPLPGEVAFVPTATPTPWPPRSTTPWPRSCWSRSRARTGWWFRPTGTWPGPVRSATSMVRCCGWTRCRPAWAAPAAGWCTSRTASTADIVTLAKGLGNGFPVGACVAAGRAATLLGPGSHGSTFGGNPVAAIAGLAVMAVIERDGLLDRANALGAHLVEAVLALGHPAITGVRGRGLLRAITLAVPVAPAVAAAALDAGFIVNAPKPDVLRLAPPLVIGADQLDSFVDALPALLESVG